MSILSYHELIELKERGCLIGVPYENIEGSSFDVTLGDQWIKEVYSQNLTAGIDPTKQTFENKLIVNDDFCLNPKEFVLAVIQETIKVPADMTFELNLNSTFARAGLDQATALRARPGYQGKLTLELYNKLNGHALHLCKGMKIGNITVHRHKIVPPWRLYKGRYNNDTEVYGAKMDNDVSVYNV